MAPEPPPHFTAGNPGLSIESVAFATGAGRLVRRSTVVLFDPTGQNTKLTSAFDAATDDDEAIDQAIEALIESELGLDPFAIVRWSTSVEIIVFGEVAVETSIPSAPLVSGAASTTWVTHTIGADRVDAGPLQVSCGQPAEPGTNLRLGIAACDGFRLDLTPTQVSSTIEAPANSPLDTAEPADQIESAEPVQPVEPAEATGLPEPAEPPDSMRPADPIEPVAAPESAVVEIPPEPAQEGAEDDAMPPGVDALWTADEAESAPDDDDPDPFAIDDPTPKIASPPPGPLLEFDPSAPAPETGDVDELDPIDASVDGIEWTDAVFGTLVFERFPNSPIDGPAVLGRRPEPSGDQTGIVVDHPEVSRNHAELQVDGWSVTLVDLESRNGTWVQPPTGEGVRRLDPEERVVLMPGTIVHLGSADVAFTWQPT